MTDAAETETAFARLQRVLAAGERPDTATSAAALAECLSEAPPPDGRIGSIIGFLHQDNAPIDWAALDACARRWRDAGQLTPATIRRLCDAALVGGRSLDATLDDWDAADEAPPPRPGPPTDDYGPFEYLFRPPIEEIYWDSAEFAPARHPRAKAAYIAALVAETTDRDADHIIDPLARLFAAPPRTPGSALLAELERIQIPLPGFPFLGQRGGDEHFFFLTDAIARSQAALAAGLRPVAFVSMPKSASAYLSAAVSQAANIPFGVASLRQTVGVRSWLEFAGGHPIALHDHLPPRREYVETLKGAGCASVILHVRDPRQFVVSLSHHLVRVKFIRFERFRTVYETEGMEGLADGLIDYLGPRLSAWMRDWKAETSRAGLPLQVTRYEDFRRAPRPFLEELLRHFNGQSSSETIEDMLNRLQDDISAGGLNFRKGQEDEWRTALTAGQVRRIADETAGQFAAHYPDLN